MQERLRPPQREWKKHMSMASWNAWSTPDRPGYLYRNYM
jgi:hypothetical protein